MKHAPRAIAAVCALVLGSACGEAGSAAPRTTGACSFGVERAIATGTGATFDGIALARGPDGLRAIWSDAAGLFARALRDDGTPTAEAVRLGARCRGGLAAATDEGRLLVACLAPAESATGSGGSVSLVALGRGATEARTTEVGAAGRDSSAIAIAVANGRTWIAWHDGTPGAQRVRLTSVGRDGAPTTPVALGNASRAGGSVALAVTASGHVLVAWAETWVDGPRLRGFVRLADASHPRVVRDLEPLSTSAPALAFTRDERGVVLAMRDERPRRARRAVFVLRIGESLSETTNAVHVGRANGAGGPAIASCGGRVVLAVPRTYGRREVLIGLHQLTPRFARDGGELQIYEYDSELSYAALACVQESVLVLYAERRSPAEPGPRLRTTMLTCPPSGRAGHR